MRFHIRIALGYEKFPGRYPNFQSSLLKLNGR